MSSTIVRISVMWRASSSTVRLVELHAVTNPKDGGVYLDILVTKKTCLAKNKIGIIKTNIFVNSFVVKAV